MMPRWTLFGIARAAGVGQFTFMGDDIGAAAGIPAGLTIGALVRVAVRRLTGRWKPAPGRDWRKLRLSA